MIKSPVAVSPTNTATGTITGTILSNNGNNVYTGTLAFSDPDPVGTWNVQVYTLDLASNGASLTTSLLSRTRLSLILHFFQPVFFRF